MTDSDNLEFTKYEIVKANGYRGSYIVKDENKQTIGKSEGYTIKRRSILFKVWNTDYSYEIIKRSKGYYIILKDEELFGALKIHRLKGQVEIRTKNENIIKLFPKNMYKTYRITHNEKRIGIANSQNWLRDSIGVALADDKYSELILCAIIGLAYNININPSRFFKK